MEVIKWLKLRARGKHAEFINCGSHQRWWFFTLWRQGGRWLVVVAPARVVVWHAALPKPLLPSAVLHQLPNSCGESRQLQGVYLQHKSYFQAPVTLKVGMSEHLGHFRWVFFQNVALVLFRFTKKNHGLLHQLKIFFFPLSILSFCCWRV